MPSTEFVREENSLLKLKCIEDLDSEGVNVNIIGILKDVKDEKVIDLVIQGCKGTIINATLWKDCIRWAENLKIHDIVILTDMKVSKFRNEWQLNTTIRSTFFIVERGLLINQDIASKFSKEILHGLLDFKKSLINTKSDRKIAKTIRDIRIMNHAEEIKVQVYFQCSCSEYHDRHYHVVLFYDVVFKCTENLIILEVLNRGKFQVIETTEIKNLNIEYIIENKISGIVNSNCTLNLTANLEFPPYKWFCKACMNFIEPDTNNILFCQNCVSKMELIHCFAPIAVDISKRLRASISPDCVRSMTHPWKIEYISDENDFSVWKNVVDAHMSRSVTALLQVNNKFLTLQSCIIKQITV
ncbi:hypothetical protein ROZALSC1DRAFT_30152 [Rozella allomycis CSF55]|uniref:Uncharacterized protein n=1 Tax=Rozella allomycis (strain CSF55) TaxID=988480 RepID=A0A075AYA2_ROZAC|nr:hypothetical protein O9G_000701 [Rozella allomycis CSF55]RKP18121.1 hypothetical protein ROZALSC1DRAFT_30152 [Rozella allomycis CSF55]|eukprot:EPZ35305.1 hypothetical protein O9G_000701 [Rozella allomycis CSF55]